MNRHTQKQFAHLPAVKGGVLTSVTHKGGETVYTYRVPPRELERSRKAAHKRNTKADAEDIGQGEGCEGGKCLIKERK
jgi:hypothetical protein